MQQQTIASFLTYELASQIKELLTYENELFEFIAQVINSKEEKYITKLRSTLQNWQNGVKSILEMDVFNINNLRSDGTRSYFIALCNAFNIYVPEPLRAPHIDSKLETVSSIDCNGIFQQLKKKIGKKYNLNNLTDDKLDQIVAKCHPFRDEVARLLWKDFTEVKNLDNKQLQNITHELYSWQLELCNFILAPDLKKHIDSYIRKPLSQRKIDPLRFLIPQMCSKDMFAIFDQDSSQAKREFFKLIEKNSELKNVKDQQKVFYVLLELFDRERAGIDSRGYCHCDFRPLYSLTQSERNEVKIWYKKNMPDTDLFDDLEIENEEDKEQDEQEARIKYKHNRK